MAVAAWFTPAHAPSRAGAAASVLQAANMMLAAYHLFRRRINYRRSSTGTAAAAPLAR